MSTSLSQNISNNSQSFKSSFGRTENISPFAESDKDRVTRKRPTVSDLYDSNSGFKRRFPSEISDIYSFKKTIRDFKTENNDLGNNEHQISDEEEAIGLTRGKRSEHLSPSLKCTPSSIRISEASFVGYNQPLSVSKSAQQHLSSPSSHSNSVTTKHTSSLSSVSSIPANQLRAHVNRADADEITDLEELEQFAKTFKQRRIKLGILLLILMF